MSGQPFMTTEEIAFLAANLKPSDRVWEWGSGASTLWLAERCRRVTSVEHQRSFAGNAIRWVPDNASILYVPPDLEYTEGTEDDGDLATFHSYVECFIGRGVDAVLIDGRARVECAKFIAERAPFGPTPELRVFLHDCHRAQYESIWRDQVERIAESDDELSVAASRASFEVVGREGNLMLLKVRF